MMAVVPETLRVPSPVTVSLALLPKTALPVTARFLLLPVMVLLKVAVVPVSVMVLAVFSVTAPV